MGNRLLISNMRVYCVPNNELRINKTLFIQKKINIKQKKKNYKKKEKNISVLLLHNVCHKWQTLINISFD